MGNIHNAVTEDKLTVPYNPNLLVTYKALPHTTTEFSPTFLTDKVTEIEWELHNGRSNKEDLSKLRGLIYGLDEQIVEWSNPNYDKDEVLVELCQYFGINPSKEVQFEATISVSGTISVPFNEVEDFDIESYFIDNVSVDSNNHEMEISDWSVDRIHDSSY